MNAKTTVAADEGGQSMIAQTDFRRVNQRLIGEVLLSQQQNFALAAALVSHLHAREDAGETDQDDGETDHIGFRLAEVLKDRLVDMQLLHDLETSIYGALPARLISES